MILVVLLYLLLAISFPLAQFCLSFSNPTFLIALRMLLSGIFILGFSVLSGNSIYIKIKDCKLLFITGLFHIYFAFVPEFWSLQYIPSLKVNLIYSLTPFISSFLAYIIFNEKIGLIKFLAIILGFIGLLPTIMQSNTQSIEFINKFSLKFIPEITLLFAVFSGCYGWFLFKKLSFKNYSQWVINGYCMLIGGFLSLITNLIIYKDLSWQVTETKPFLVALFSLIIISNVIIYNLYGYLLKKHSITLISLAGFLCPLFGAFYAYLFFKEELSMNYFISFVFVTLAIIIFNFQDFPDRYIRKK